MKNDELKHYGILGMKWGIRRYQNKDGTLTAAGKKRASKLESQYNELTGKKIGKSSKKVSEKQETKKSLKDMTDDELKTNVNRLQSERMYLYLNKEINTLQPKKISMGKKIFNKVANDVVIPAAMESGKKLLSEVLQKKGREMIKSLN